MANAWMAVSSISYGGVLAFGPGDIVPNSHVTTYGLEAKGFVAPITLPSEGVAGVPVTGLDPVTQREFDLAAATFAKKTDLPTAATLAADPALKAAFVAAVDEAGASIPGHAGRVVFNADGDPVTIELVTL